MRRNRREILKERRESESEREKFSRESHMLKQKRAEAALPNTCGFSAAQRFFVVVLLDKGLLPCERRQ